MKFNLKQNANELIEAVKKLVNEERKITHQVLLHLQEIDHRKIFAERGYSSLFRFCVEELGYSDGAAFRRIEAMRMLRSTPELGAKIQSGSLSLSTVAMAGAFIREENREISKNYSPIERLKLIETLEGKSKRESEKILHQTKVQNRKEVGMVKWDIPMKELKLHVSDTFLDKLTRLKELRPGKKDVEVLEYALDEILKRIDPELRAGRAKSKESIACNPFKSTVTSPGESRKTVEQKTSNIKSSNDFKKIQSPDTKNQEYRSRYIPASLRHFVWQRDKGCCTFYSPQTKTRCASRFGLEIEHITPFAQGGAHTSDNLTLRCKTHNQLSAIKYYGQQKMNQYFEKTGS